MSRRDWRKRWGLVVPADDDEARHLLLPSSAGSESDGESTDSESSDGVTSYDVTEDTEEGEFERNQLLRSLNLDLNSESGSEIALWLLAYVVEGLGESFMKKPHLPVCGSLAAMAIHMVIFPVHWAFYLSALGCSIIGGLVEYRHILQTNVIKAALGHLLASAALSAAYAVAAAYAFFSFSDKTYDVFDTKIGYNQITHWRAKAISCGFLAVGLLASWLNHNVMKGNTIVLSRKRAALTAFFASAVSLVFASTVPSFFTPAYLSIMLIPAVAYGITLEVCRYVFRQQEHSYYGALMAVLQGVLSLANFMAFVSLPGFFWRETTGRVLDSHLDDAAERGALGMGAAWFAMITACFTKRKMMSMPDTNQWRCAFLFRDQVAKSSGLTNTAHEPSDEALETYVNAGLLTSEQQAELSVTYRFNRFLGGCY